MTEKVNVQFGLAFVQLINVVCYNIYYINHLYNIPHVIYVFDFNISYENLKYKYMHLILLKNVTVLKYKI